MADTRVQLEIEDWVRQHWMPREYGQEFSRERLRLSPGGVFDFDAVSHDKTFAATISTSGARTASGKLGVGKKMKIRSDIYFLLLSGVTRRLVVFTERDMHDEWVKERGAGRVPEDIEFASLSAQLGDLVRFFRAPSHCRVPAPGTKPPAVRFMSSHRAF